MSWEGEVGGPILRSLEVDFDSTLETFHDGAVSGLLSPIPATGFVRGAPTTTPQPISASKRFCPFQSRSATPQPNSQVFATAGSRPKLEDGQTMVLRTSVPALFHFLNASDASRATCGAPHGTCRIACGALCLCAAVSPRARILTSAVGRCAHFPCHVNPPPLRGIVRGGARERFVRATGASRAAVG
eukprot:scaffold923_cov256-Pinguiococcus_pyrenoidosus.AAC.64